MYYELDKNELTQIITESVKHILLNEEDNAYLYGAKEDGNIPMDMTKNIEGADLQINSAGTIHAEHCEIDDTFVCVTDTQDRLIKFPKEDLERLLDGEQIRADLYDENGQDYDVFISIAHASENQRLMRFMRDRQYSDKPIFGGSKID